jgi:hypothetical protein
MLPQPRAASQIFHPFQPVGRLGFWRPLGRRLSFQPGWRRWGWSAAVILKRKAGGNALTAPGARRIEETERKAVSFGRAFGRGWRLAAIVLLP